MASILVVEDSVETQLVLKRALEDKHQVYTCYSLASARDYIYSHQVDLILLDLMLPDGPGLSLLEELCVNQAIPKVPIIIVSSLGDLTDRVSGLKSGADDYITKPFDRQELLARIESVLRRGPARHSDSILTVADVCIDLIRQTASVKSGSKLTDLNLTPIEFKILVNLSHQVGMEVSRDVLKRNVWENTFISERNVDTHICKLRRKLAGTLLDVQNKRNCGYYLSVMKSEPSISEKRQELPAYGINSRT